jgi:hypothetical protein
LAASALCGATAARLATEICGRPVNKELRLLDGQVEEKKSDVSVISKILNLPNVQKISCECAKTELLRNDVYIHKHLPLHTDWLRVHATPFGVMKK